MPHTPVQAMAINSRVHEVGVVRQYHGLPAAVKLPQPPSLPGLVGQPDEDAAQPSSSGQPSGRAAGGSRARFADELEGTDGEASHSPYSGIIGFSSFARRAQSNASDFAATLPRLQSEVVPDGHAQDESDEEATATGWVSGFDHAAERKGGLAVTKPAGSLAGESTSLLQVGGRAAGLLGLTVSCPWVSLPCEQPCILLCCAMLRVPWRLQRRTAPRPRP